MTETVSIRRSLLTSLVAIVLVLGLSIVAMMFLSTRRAIQGLSQSLINQASRRTEVKLVGFFEPVTRQVGALRSWAVSGLLQLESPADLVAMLQPLLEEFPFSSAIFVADDRGHEFLVRREPYGWSTRQVRSDEWQGRAVVESWSITNQEWSTSEIETEYDPRNRPWYESAVAAFDLDREISPTDEVIWTEPYQFFTTGAPGITASAAFRDSEGRTGVVGIDIELRDLSLFTSSIELLDDGTVFVLTHDGRLIGLPRLEQVVIGESELDDLLLKTPRELGTAAAEDASDILVGNPDRWGSAQRLVSAGEPWWGQLTPFDLTKDQMFLIGVAVPEEDILGEVHQQRLWVAGITLMVLALAIWRAVTLARRLSRPVEELALESERISTGDLEPGPAIESRVTEVKRLAEAHDQMRQGLKTLLKLERDLQVARQIQENTLPETLPELAGFDLAGCSHPADETGGDSYDVIGLTGSRENPAISDGQADRALLMLADATGHGIGPALSVTQLRAMLRIAVRVGAEMTGLVEKINAQLKADLPTGRFITAWFGLIDTADSSLVSLSAGQAPLLLYRNQEDRFDILSSDAIPLGMFPTIKIEPPAPIRLDSGDLFAVLSDGFFEAKNSEGEEQDTEPICDVIRRHKTAPCAEIMEHIRAVTDEFTHGAPPDDDRTILLIKRI